MFLREARLAALLAHPNVVHAFAFGEAYGELFLAMQYVEGEPLSSVLAAARASGFALEPALVAHVLAEACDGLHAAHELRDVAGNPLHVVHRDVSPHNVIVAYDGHVKILDFGVAKFDAGGQATRTGEVKGKMAYMSPEQALGEALDRRSDLFSMGAVLFECLAGRRLWGDGTDMEIMRKLALEDPPALDHVRPGAAPELVDLCRRLVARDRQRRPATAREVAVALRSFATAPGRGQDSASVRSVMDRLFAAEAQKRRDLLTGELQRIAPSRVEVLRRTLDPSDSLAWPTLTEPVIVRSAFDPAPMEVRRKRLWRRAFAVVAVAVVVGVGARLEVRTGGAIATRTTAPAPAPAPALATATATATATPTATATATPTPTPTATPTPTPTGATTGASTARPRPPVVHPPPPKLPDVDPSPF
jgi:serine/threonine-protein kinase